MAKGLKYIPSDQTRAQAYDQLQKKPHSVSMKGWIEYGEWTRFDPRLAEIWVHAFTKSWRNIAPIPFKENILTSVYPAAFGLLLEFVNELIFSNPQFNDQDWPHYWKWVTENIPIAENEQFFIGQRFPGSKLQMEDTLFSHSTYRKWGYYAQEVLIHATPSAKNKTRIDYETRKLRLEELIKEKKKITVQDYVDHLKGFVSRRQAQRDLKDHAKLKASGKTKGRVYS